MKEKKIEIVIKCEQARAARGVVYFLVVYAHRKKKKSVLKIRGGLFPSPFLSLSEII